VASEQPSAPPLLAASASGREVPTTAVGPNGARFRAEGCGGGSPRAGQCEQWPMPPEIYEVHWPDPKVPVAGTARALEQLVREGKFRHVGVSNYGAAG